MRPDLLEWRPRREWPSSLLEWRPRREWPRILFLAKDFALCNISLIRELNLAQSFQYLSLNLNLRPVVL